MSRQDFVLNGEAHSFAHLAPFVLEVSGKAAGSQTFKVLVTFGCHTFTRDMGPTDPPERRYIEEGEERCFCDDRYRYSLNLPRIINYAAGGRVFFSEGRNMLCVDWLPGLAAPYAVFFNLRPWRERGLHAAMTIVSAYDKDGLPERLPAITFATLVGTVASGQKIKVPRDLRSIKK